MRFRSIPALLGLAALGLSSCTPEAPFSIDYEAYTLDNGLQVILHEDRSDPITAVAVLYHVGSNREEPGRTGFAHLFEHMMFQQSQHVGEDQFFKKIRRRAEPSTVGRRSTKPSTSRSFRRTRSR